MKNRKNVSLLLNSASGETKQQSLISELLRLIRTELQEGDNLPSVNSISRELNLSRDTVFKAYTELKKRNIIKSTPTKGYYVNQEINKVLLLLDYYSPFKDTVYQEIKKEVEGTYSIDLVFHHYNQKIFDAVVLDSIGKYDRFLIMNFDVEKFVISDSLRRIDPSKLLLLDIPIRNWKDFDSVKYSFICQDFNEAVFDSLVSIDCLLQKYQDFIFVNPDQLKHPSETMKAFSKYCVQYSIKPHVVRNSLLEVRAGEAYFVLRQRDLTHILKQCREKKLVPGRDVGILAYNDNPLYEFVNKGITVISTDFRMMGNMAARFIMQQENIQYILPTRVITRKSL